MQEIKVRIVSNSGLTTRRAVVSTEGQVTHIHAEPNSHIQFYSDGKIINGDQKIDGKNIKLTKVGPNLVVEVEGKSVLEVSDFFTTDGATLDGSSWSFPQSEGLMQSSTGVVATPEATAAMTPITPAITPAAGGISWGNALAGVAGVSALGGHGGAAAAAAGAAGGDSYTAAPSTIISGIITAGPVLGSGHDLSVNLYNGSGQVLASNVFVNTQGRFSVDVGSYRGAVVAKVVNSGNGFDYTDEFTGLGKNLNATFLAVGDVTNSTLTLNINPLTSVAAQKSGLAANGTGVVTSTSVNTANADVATAFGVTNITGTDPVTTLENVGPNKYDPLTNGRSNAESIGALLAAFSGADSDNSGDSQKTIDDMVAALSGNSLSASGLAQLIAGSRTTAPSVAIDILRTTVQDILGINTNHIIPATIVQLTALDNISQGAENNNAALTLADFADAGVTGITASNLASINDALNSPYISGTMVDTVAELQMLIDSYNAILNAADGVDNMAPISTNVSAAQYALIVGAGLNVSILNMASLLSDTVDIKNTTDVDTVAKLQGLAFLAGKVLTQAATGTQSISMAEFMALGIDPTVLTPGRAAKLSADIANVGISNVDTLAKLTAFIDTTVATPTFTLVTDTGNHTLGSQTDNYTSAGTFSVVGLESGATWEFSTDGVNWSGPFTASTTTFTVSPGTYASGDIQVRQTDLALNVSTSAVNATSVVIDTTAPLATSQITDISKDSGTLGDFVTNDTSLFISGSNSALGNNETVQVSVDNGATWHNTSAVKATSWTYDNTAQPFGIGSFTLQTRVIDDADNVGTTSAQSLTITAVGAIATSRIKGISDDAGIVGDYVTNDTTLVISGDNTALNFGDVVQISLDNGSTWFNTQSLSANTWEYDNSANPMKSGSYVLQTRVMDSFGVNGVAYSQNVAIITRTPVTPSFAISIDTGSSTLGSSSDGITANGLVSVSGIEPTGTWQYSFNGGKSWSAVQSSSVTSFVLNPGNYGIGAVRVRQTDLATNIGTAAQNAAAIVVDTIAPTIDLDSGASANRTVSVTDVNTFATAGVAINTATTSVVEASNSVANVQVAFSTLYNGANEVLRIDTTDIQANGDFLPSTVSDGINTWGSSYDSTSHTFTFALSSGSAATNAQAQTLVQSLAYRDTTVPDTSMGDSADWTLINATVTANTLAAPDSAMTAEVVTLNASTANADMQRTFTGLSASTAYTYSFWAKLGTATNIDVVVTDGSGWNTLAGEKQYTSADGLSTTGWTKLSHTFTTDSSGQASVYLGANSETGLATQSAGTVDLWGARLHLAGETYTRTISVSATDSAGNTGAASTTTINITGTTPLMLDLNGDGIHTVGLSAGVVFDVDADGTRQATGWSDGQDGLLVLDLNHDGVINDGSELFGSGTTLNATVTSTSNSSKAIDGYAALAQYDRDSNGLSNGVIDSQDTVFNQLQVWIDTNVDGITNAGELKTLAELGVKSLSLATTKGTATENGNAALLQSTWTDAQNNTHALADWTLNTVAMPVALPVEVHKVL
jgi:hypothetical protein